MDRTFNFKSVLWWLTLLIPLAIIFLGARFIYSPEVAAAGYGVPLGQATDLRSYLYVKGIRDIFSGLIFFPFLFTCARRTVGTLMLIAVIIPVADGIIVSKEIVMNAQFLSIHWGTALYMTILSAALLWKKPRSAV